ncbi:MAG: 5-oxoprolinase subunit PxpB [Clostridia bacterium]|nr:5-oxoprolinase subunit PxpB [Clostridia bacterium]
MELSVVNEDTLMIHVADNIMVENYFLLKHLKEALKANFDEITEISFGYVDLMLTVKNLSCYHRIHEWLKDYKMDLSKPDAFNLIEIPVCYDDEYALDKEEVVKETNLSFDEVVKRHTTPIYFTYFLGFTYGFAYLGGLDNTIAVKRKTVPRLKIEKGSVGIAGEQTGIYPSELPGGWQVIGRTPLQLYNQEDTLIRAGMFVKFVPISKDDFKNYDDKPKVKVISWPYA